MKKNKKEVSREFDKEKYFEALKYFHKKKFDIRDVDKFFYKKKNQISLLLKEKKIVKNQITKFSKKINTIVELGCGYGSKGLVLTQLNKLKNKNFIFLDLSKNGIKIIDQIILNSKKYTSNLKIGTCDFYNQNIKHKIPINSLIYTSYALHYKKKLNDKFIKIILKKKPMLVIHFEPIFEHFNNNTIKNIRIRNYFKKNNYSENLLSILKRYEKRRKIKIIKEIKNCFAVNNLLPLSIIVWTPKLNLGFSKLF